MNQELIRIARHIRRFGILSGLKIYLKNKVFKAGESTISCNSLAHPLFLRRGTSDIPTFAQVFLNQEYAYPLDIDPAFIIDCGANIGLASLYFKNSYPNAFVVSIEPEDSNFQMLKKNTARYSRIECIKSGIWNKNAILRVTNDFNCGNWGFTCKEVAVEDATTVRGISVSELMKKFGNSQIDVLKIDIEGAEFELFSSGYQEWLPHTKVIMIELHDRFRKGCSKSFLSAIAQYDFSVFLSGENIICVRN